MKKVNANFIYKQGKQSLISDFRGLDSDVDIMNLLSQCVNTLDEIKELKRLVFEHNKVYDHNILSVCIHDKNIKIITVADDNIEVPKKLFVQMINDWEIFLKHKKDFKKEYFI